MIVRRILYHLKSTTPYLCKSSNCELNVSRNFFKCKQTMRPVPVLNIAQITNAELVRHYAKGRDRPKSQGKKKLELREDILGEYFNVDKIKGEMEDVIDYMKEQFLENLSVRSTSGVIESIPIEFEGAQYTIRDLAQINRKNPKVVVLNFSAFPQTIQTVVQTLENSELNLNPQQDGTTISIPVPKVTREHREKLAKSANAIYVKCRAAVKEVHIKFMKKLDLRSVNEKISAEKMKIINDQLLLLADLYIAELDKMKNEKVRELLRTES